MSANRVESAYERLLFSARWLLAPLYLILAATLLLLLARFALDTVELFRTGLFGSEDHLIVGVLGLVDLSLMAGLVVIVIFSGYENFVSKFDLKNHADRPDWMSNVTFSELKLKLMASIVAISAIHLLEDFMNVPSSHDRDLGWRAGLHLLFVVSAVLLAYMDRFSHPGSEGERR